MSLQVNLPTFFLIYHAKDDDYTFRVAIGSEKSPTPVLNSSIRYLTTAPNVIIPKARFLNEILPNVKGDTSFFKKHHYAI